MASSLRASPSDLVLRRIAWIREQVEYGYAASFTVSSQGGTERIKVTISYDRFEPSQTMSLQMLDYISTMLHKCPVVDKGHRSHSRNCSEILFWIRQVGNSAGNNIMSQPEDLPPVPPPPLSIESNDGVNELDVLQHKIDDMAERMVANLSYSYCMYPMLEEVQGAVGSMVVPQDLVDAQNNTISTLRAWADSESKLHQHLDSRLDNISASLGSKLYNLEHGLLKLAAKFVNPIEVMKCDVATQAPASTMKRYIFRRGIDLRASADAVCVNIGVQAPPQRMKRYSFKKQLTMQPLETMDVGIGEDPVFENVSVEEVRARLPRYVIPMQCSAESRSAATQCTARMIEEAIEELDFFGSEGASDEGMDELISVPEIQFSRDELYRRKVRVLENGAQMFGRIVELYIALSSQQPIYRVRFDDGDQQDFTREQVEAILM